MLCDLVWSDPELEVTGWMDSERGVSYVFGSDVISSFLKKNDMDLICRLVSSGDSPPCIQIIFSSIIATTGKQLKHSVNCFQILTEYLLLLSRCIRDSHAIKKNFQGI